MSDFVEQAVRLRHKTGALVAVTKFDRALSPLGQSHRVDCNGVRLQAATEALHNGLEAARDLVVSADGDFRVLATIAIHCLESARHPLKDASADLENETAFSAASYAAEKAHVIAGAIAKLLPLDQPR